MEWLPAIATILTSLGVGTILPAVGKHVLASFTGRGQRKRSELDRAWASRDVEARKRRIVERHAGLLERLLVSAPCVDPKDIPAWPSYGGDTGPNDLGKRNDD